MKNIFIAMLFLLGCTPKVEPVPCSCVPKVEPIPSEFSYGDKVVVVSGFYRGSSATILNEIADDIKSPCKVHQYFVTIARNGLYKEGYLCHEDLVLK